MYSLIKIENKHQQCGTEQNIDKRKAKIKTYLISLLSQSGDNMRHAGNFKCKKLGKCWSKRKKKENFISKIRKKQITICGFFFFFCAAFKFHENSKKKKRISVERELAKFEIFY